MLIVTYHAVAGPSSPVCATPAELDADLEALARAGFTFVSLDDCAAWLAGTCDLPSRAAVVTFDDAYANVVTSGAAILKRYSVPATVFVIGARVGADNQWPGQWRSIAPMPLADWSQLAELVAAGIAIGSHSWSHPVLLNISADDLEREIAESADRLEQRLQVPVRHFAYPYGLRGPREIAAARRYTTAVNADPGVVERGADPHDLHRIDCHDLRIAIRLKCMHSGALIPYLAARRRLRGVRRTADRLLGRT